MRELLGIPFSLLHNYPRYENYNYFRLPGKFCFFILYVETLLKLNDWETGEKKNPKLITLKFLLYFIALRLFG